MTTKQLERIRVLNQQGKSDPEIAKALGMSTSSIRHHREKMGIPANRVRQRYKIPLNRIREMNLAGMNDTAIAEELGLPLQRIHDIRTGMGLPVVRKRRRSRDKMTKYSAYSKHTSEFVCEGTAQEVADFLGLKKCTVYSEVTRTKQGCPQGRYEIVRVEDNEDE